METGTTLVPHYSWLPSLSTLTIDLRTTLHKVQ